MIWNNIREAHDFIRPIVMNVLSKTQACGSSIAGIKGSNPTEGIHVRVLCLLCVL